MPGSAGQPRSEPDQHQLCRAEQFDAADEQSPLHPPYQRVLEEVENHAASIALTFMAYNFARTHKSLANPYPRTPAMAAGIADHIWTCEEIAALLD